MAIDPTLPASTGRIGGGWGAFTAFEISRYETYSLSRRSAYGLRSDGLLFRWAVDGNGVFHRAGSYSGFASVKSMALIPDLLRIASATL